MANEGFGRSAESGVVTMVTGQVTFDAASCGAAAVTLQTITLAEAQLGDVVLLIPPAGGLSVAVAAAPGYCSVAGTVKVPMINPTAGPLDPDSAVYEYILLRKQPLG